MKPTFPGFVPNPDKPTVLLQTAIHLGQAHIEPQNGGSDLSAAHYIDERLNQRLGPNRTRMTHRQASNFMLITGVIASQISAGTVSDR